MNIKFFTQLLSGDDIFISYRWGYKPYALKLAEELEKRGLDCFIDESSLHRGESIPGTITRSIRRSRMFVLIATHDIPKSTWIPQELELARTYKRKIVPINVDNSLGGISLDATPWDALRDLSRIEESAAALKDANPSDYVALKIDESYNFTRQRVKTIRGLFVAALLFFAVSLAAVGSAVYAVEARKQAQVETRRLLDEADRARTAATDAASDRNMALGERDRARDEKVKAEDDRDQAQRDTIKQREIAAKQRREALRQRAIAETKRKSAFALYLNQQAQQVYEQNPELGVRLDLEALKHAPANDNLSQKVIVASLRELTKEARAAMVGTGDIENVVAVPGSSLVVVTPREGRSQLQIFPSGDLVETLPEKVVDVEDSTGYPHPGWNPYGFPFFVILYKSGLKEARDLASGAVVFSGHIKSIEYPRHYDRGEYFIDKEAGYFIVRYKEGTGSSDELRKADTPSIRIPLEGNFSDEDFVRSGPLFAINYSNAIEIRKVKDGKILHTFDQKGARFQVNWKHSLFAVRFQKEDDSYTVEVRDTDKGEPVPFARRPAFLEFSPHSPYFVIGYDGASSEIRRDDGPQPVATLSGDVTKAVFIHRCNGVIVTYASGKSEVRAESDGHLVARLDDGLRDAKLLFNGEILLLTYFRNGGLEDEIRSAANPSTVINGGYGMLSQYSTGSQCPHLAIPTAPYPRAQLFNAVTGQQVDLPDAADVKFVSGSPFAVISYLGDRTIELRNLCTGRADPLSLTGPSVWIKMDSHSDVFVISAKGGYELIDKSSGLSLGRINAVYEPFQLQNAWTAGSRDMVAFSPRGDRVVVNYRRRDSTGATEQISELRSTETGELIKSFEDGVIPKFNPTGTVFVASSMGTNRGLDVRSAETGALIVTAALRVDFSPDGSLFLVGRADSHTELWSADRKPHIFTELKPLSNGVAFDARGDRLITYFADGTSYLIDATWLKSTWNVSGPLEDAKLVNAACRLATMGKLDDARLRTLLLGQLPLACQGK